MGVGLTCAGIFHHEVQRLLRLYHLKELYWEGEEEQAGLGESGRAAILPPRTPQPPANHHTPSPGTLKAPYLWPGFPCCSACLSLHDSFSSMRLGSVPTLPAISS